MSSASTGNRPSATTSPRSPSTSPPTDMTPRGSRPISTIAAARPAWPGASRTTRISRSTLYDAFTRYVALGHRLEISAWACVLDRLLEKCSGRWYDLVPRSREHAKNAAAVDRAFLGWLARRQGRRRPFFAFLNYNDAHTPL